MNFKPLQIEDYTALKPFFERQVYDLSPYSLLSLFAWNGHVYNTSWRTEGPSAILAFQSDRDPQDRYLVLPVPPPEGLEAEDLARLAGRAGIPTFWHVPDDWVGRLGRPALEARFHLSEQREYEDYVYRTADLAELRGNRYARKRNLIHQFEKAFVSRGRVAVEPIRRENAAECLAFLNVWCNQRGNMDPGVTSTLLCERQAVINALNNLEDLEGIGILIRIDGAVSAFGISSRLNATMATLNFEKAYPDVRGLYQYLDRECARLLFAGSEYINKESDMSLPDLAKSKESYYPVRKLRSWRLDVR
jgi:hypothetical protein